MKMLFLLNFREMLEVLVFPRIFSENLGKIMENFKKNITQLITTGPDTFQAVLPGLKNFLEISRDFTFF